MTSSRDFLKTAISDMEEIRTSILLVYGNMEKEADDKEKMIRATKETMDFNEKVLAIESFTKDVDRIKELGDVVLQVEKLMTRYRGMLKALAEE